MKIIVPGHVYELHPVDVDPAGLRERQIVSFVRRRDFVGELLSIDDRSSGILSQELLRVLIDRVLYLYAERPCDEDTEILTKLRECLILFESRAARSSIERLSKPEKAEVCPICQHLLCFHRGTQ